MCFIFLILLSPPKRQIIALINVRLKHDTAKVGIACAHALIQTSFPAFERNLSFQPWIRFQILSFRYAKVWVRDLPTYAGNPRYFSVFASALICSSSSTSFLYFLPPCILAKHHRWFVKIDSLSRATLINNDVARDVLRQLFLKTETKMYYVSFKARGQHVFFCVCCVCFCPALPHHVLWPAAYQSNNNILYRLLNHEN